MEKSKFDKRQRGIIWLLVAGETPMDEIAKLYNVPVKSIHSEVARQLVEIGVKFEKKKQKRKRS